MHPAVEFLEKFLGDTYWVVTAITPDGPVETRTFGRSSADALENWLTTEHGRRNFYFGVNIVDAPLETKAKKENIVRVNAFHVDIDPARGADLAAERVVIRNRLDAYNPAPTVIIDSGGGFQAFWKLAATIPVAGDPGSLEAYNRQIETDLGGDHCHNLDRIMRLPGTVNVPNRKKRERGRQPAPTSVVFADWGRTYGLTNFVQAPAIETTAERPQQRVEIPANLPEVDLDRLPIEAEWRRLIMNGDDPEHPKYEGDRSRATYAVTCRLLRAGVSDDVVAAILLDENLAISEHVRAQPSPETYAARQIARARDAVADPDLEFFNEKYAVVNDEGKVYICEFSEERDRIGEKEIIRKRARRMTIESFITYYRNRSREIQLGDGKTKKIRATDYWLDHPLRRTYAGVTFDPTGRVAPDVYNEWRGYAFAPRRGDWSKFQAHIRDVIAAGVEERYQYILNWLARAVQFPGEPGRVAIVLKGEKGSGKGIFAASVGRLFGQHFFHVSSSDRLFGRFAGWLRTCVFLFLDEAYWAGNKADEGKLKALITEQDFVVERKFFDAETSKNFTHIIMASNEEHVAPTSGDERRFFITEVSPHKKGDSAYFKELVNELDNGGYEAMLYDLRQRDISEFNVEKVPTTAISERHNWDSATGVMLWWADVLQTGSLPNSGASPWATEGTTWRIMYQDYCAHRAQAREGSHFGGLGDFARKLRGMIPSEPTGKRVRATDGAVPRHITMPPASQCRKYFREKIMRTTYAPWSRREESPESDGPTEAPF